MKTQGDKAHRQHDDNGFYQCPHELIDRPCHGRGLVLHRHQAQACRQGCIDIGSRRFERLAQGDDVAPLGHGDSQANHLLALEVHLHTRRVDNAPFDLGDISQTQLLARTGANRHGAQRLHRFELPRHPHLHHIQGRLNRARALNRVLLAQLRQHLVHVQAELGQALLRNFNVDFFVLHAKQVHLVDIG